MKEEKSGSLYVVVLKSISGEILKGFLEILRDQPVLQARKMKMSQQLQILVTLLQFLLIQWILTIFATPLKVLGLFIYFLVAGVTFNLLPLNWCRTE